MNETSQPCMVCLENTDSNMNTIATLTTIVKSCECSYWIHESCINAWLIKEPVCPICKTVMFYADNSNTSNNVITDTSNNAMMIIGGIDMIRERKLIRNILTVCIMVLCIVVLVILFT
uniref:RING-type domain-containing protein n=1 Tax=viral metagenome TaxID=1070528 RepID=A0A6C0HFT6_9ZZZZ